MHLTLVSHLNKFWSVILQGSLVGFACTGWDTCPASLALLDSLAPMASLNATRKVKSLTFLTYLTLVNPLKRYLVGYLKSAMFQFLKRMVLDKHLHF